jgi:hypothetical protein
MAPPFAGFISAMIRMYDSSYTHVRPPLYAFDIYGDQAGIQNGNISSIDNQLRMIATELTTKGEGQKPIIIQETYFNSPQMCDRIKYALDTFELKIQYIFQWPLRFGTSESSFVNDLSPFDQYMPSVKKSRQCRNSIILKSRDSTIH